MSTWVEMLSLLVAAAGLATAAVLATPIRPGRLRAPVQPETRRYTVD